MKEEYIKDKYIKRLIEAQNDGFLSCIIEKEEELEVQKIFFKDDHYYFLEDENSRLWLSWE